MRKEDIHSYADLETYIKLEIAKQTIQRRMVELELNEEWFFKFAKLVRFALKHDLKEKGVLLEIEPQCKQYVLKVNKIFTIVKRK